VFLFKCHPPPAIPLKSFRGSPFHDVSLFDCPNQTLTPSGNRLVPWFFFALKGPPTYPRPACAPPSLKDAEIGYVNQTTISGHDLAPAPRVSSRGRGATPFFTPQLPNCCSVPAHGVVHRHIFSRSGPPDLNNLPILSALFRPVFPHLLFFRAAATLAGSSLAASALGPPR